jgi:hypothetical protein
MIPDGHTHIFHYSLFTCPRSAGGCRLFTAFFLMIVHCKEWLRGELKKPAVSSLWGGGDDWIEVIIETAGLLAITPLRLPDWWSY